MIASPCRCLQAVVMQSEARTGHWIVQRRPITSSPPACLRWRAAAGSSAGPARSSVAAAAAPTDLLVLDFDGVVVDSEKEVSASAMQAAAEHWPQLFGPAALPERERRRVLAGLRATRPRLIKGSEALLMARLILEDGDGAIPAILDGWEERLLPASLQRFGEGDGSRLAAAFEAVRSRGMDGDFGAWAALNLPFPGVQEALQETPYPWYIVSSKKGSRLVPLLNATLGLEAFTESSPRVYASCIPPNERKIEALRAIMRRPVAADPSTTLHFVDDRAETLHAIVTQAPDIAERYQLYLAAWGYATEQELRHPPPGVRLLQLSQFCELLRFGLVMCVDDGCEPTAEEVEAGLKS